MITIFAWQSGRLHQPRQGVVARAAAPWAVAATFFGVMSCPGRALATEYYVSPTGSDSSAGTLAQPFGTLQKGHDAASAGDTVWLRGGTYKPTKQIKLSKSGLSDAQRIRFWAYQKEIPLIDFSGYVTTNAALDVPALLVTGNWLHLRGLEIANVPVGPSGAHSISAVRSEGASNNTFELLNIHHTFGPGLFISKGTGGNLIQNCDSHDNYDKDGSQGDGQNADGFGVHYQESGPSTILRGCRAWFNSDDGYDLISQEVPVRIEDSWAVSNGYANGGTTSPSSGNGNGFKAGSSQTGVRHVLQNNVAWKNKAAGFYANHSSGGNTWLNNTAYMNGVAYNMLASAPGDSTTTIVLSGDKVHRLRNNIGFPNKNTNMSGVDSKNNTWDLGISEASSDFVSTVDTGYMGPRQADGRLPAIDFMRLRAGSPLIDKGVDVGLSYAGASPDLGAYEYGAVQGGGAGAAAGGANASAGMGAGGAGTSSGGNLGSGGSGTGAAGSAANAGTAGAGSGIAGNAGAVTGGAPSEGSGGNNAGMSSGSGAAGTPSGTAGLSPVGGAGRGAVGGSGDGATNDAGCTCRVAQRAPGVSLASLWALGAVAFFVQRRRSRVYPASGPSSTIVSLTVHCRSRGVSS